MSISSAHSDAFYREVATTGIVWGIKDADGFPAPLNGDGVRAMPFWSSKSRAALIVDSISAYKGFSPVEIDWTVFCQRWVPGLIRDGILVGINWSGKTAKGFDINPGDLVRNVEALRGA